MTKKEFSYNFRTIVFIVFGMVAFAHLVIFLEYQYKTRNINSRVVVRSTADNSIIGESCWMTEQSDEYSVKCANALREGGNNYFYLTVINEKQPNLFNVYPLNQLIVKLKQVREEEL